MRGDKIVLVYIEILLFLSLIATALAVAFTKKNLSAVIIFTVYSLVMSIVWVLIESPDLAITEAAVGAGITSLLFYVLLSSTDELKEFENIKYRKKKQKQGKNKKAYNFFGITFTVLIIVLLLITVNSLPPYGGVDNPAVNEVFNRYVSEGVNETGALNLVAAVILDYRAFDTFGEAIMLFTSTMAVVGLLRKNKDEVIIDEKNNRR